MTHRKLENYLYGVKADGLQTDKTVYVGVTPGKVPDLHVAGNLYVGGTISSTAEVIGAEVISSTSSNAFAVGQNGATNPAINIDTLTVGAATGVDIVAAAAGSGVALKALSSATNEGMSINAKGTGTLALNNTATGTVYLGSNTSIHSSAATALAVGANDSTNPAFNVDASTASSVTGVNVKSAAAGAGVAMSALSSGANEGFNINAKGTGTLALQNVSTGAVYLGSNTSIHSGSANALAVGPNDVTNPAFNVDASTASSASGFNVKSAAAGSGVFLSAISSATNENISLNAKGTGSINIGTTSTGGILIGNTTTVVSNTGPQAGGVSYAALLFGNAGGFGIYYGSGAPTVSAAQGSLYMRTDGSSTSTRFYVNNSSGSGTSWTAVTTAA